MTTLVLGTIVGKGLHSGVASRVGFVRADGPVVLRVGAVEAEIRQLVVVDTSRSTTVANAAGTLRLATIEHVFAALGGLGVYEGLVVAFEGAEAPLADGGARAFADALCVARVRASAPHLRVAVNGSISVGASVYEFGIADHTDVEVHVDFNDARLARHARWRGDAEDFFERIAVARTFGFEHEIRELLARGLASHVASESVVVIGAASIVSAGRAFTSDEPARHKLLDLIGDLYLYGGPPRGTVRASRPGHAATHTAMQRAFDLGLVARTRG